MGSKLNVRYGSCFNEEDLIGKIVAITKGSMHGSSVSKRLLQRWLLQMNANLAEKRGKTDWEEGRASKIRASMAFTGKRGIQTSFVKPVQPKYLSCPIHKITP